MCAPRLASLMTRAAPVLAALHPGGVPVAGAVPEGGRFGCLGLGCLGTNQRRRRCEAQCASKAQQERPSARQVIAHGGGVGAPHGGGVTENLRPSRTSAL